MRDHKVQDCTKPTTPSATQALASTTSVVAACAVGETVQCPDSNVTCAGDACCPGIAETRGMPFSCPSASVGFIDCEMRDHKVQDCTKPTTPSATQALAS